MEINWKMTISLVVVSIIGILMIWVTWGAYNDPVEIEEKCEGALFSAQTHRDDICTRTVYCSGINRVFYLSDCRKHDAILGADD